MQLRTVRVQVLRVRVQVLVTEVMRRTRPRQTCSGERLRMPVCRVLFLNAAPRRHRIRIVSVRFDEIAAAMTVFCNPPKRSRTSPVRASTRTRKDSIPVHCWRNLNISNRRGTAEDSFPQLERMLVVRSMPSNVRVHRPQLTRNPPALVVRREQRSLLILKQVLLASGDTLTPWHGKAKTRTPGPLKAKTTGFLKSASLFGRKTKWNIWHGRKRMPLPKRPLVSRRLALLSCRYRTPSQPARRLVPVFDC
jgi:hypothetical protein